MQSPFFNVAPELTASVVAIGAFDGVHRGHQVLLRQMVQEARQHRVPAVVYTFDPPPRVALCGAAQLTSLEEKVTRLKACGVDVAVVASFDETFRNRPPLDFIRELQRLRPLQVHVGQDFRFGQRRAGDVTLLSRHFSVQTLAPVACTEGEVISSTRVRNLLAAGEYAEAQMLLGWL